MTGQIAAAVGVAVFAIAQAIYWFREAKRRSQEHLLQSRMGGVLSETKASLVRISDEEQGAFARLCDQAGLAGSTDQVLRTAIGAVLALALIGLIVANVVGFIGFAFMGAVGVYIYLDVLIEKRTAEITDQMPRMIEIIVLALRAGNTLPRAMELASTEVPAPLGTELKRLYEENKMGRSVEDGFVAMSKRLPMVSTLKTIVTSMLILRQTGGNLVEVLERVMENIAAHTQYKQRLKALTAEGRLSASVLMALPGAFGGLMALTQPAYMRPLVESPLGYFMLFMVFTLWGIGSLWVRALLKAQ
jgi:tight adherence protein B